MKKTIKKILASLMVATIVLTAAPLSGFVGLKFNLNLDWLNFDWLDFSQKASAATHINMTPDQAAQWAAEHVWTCTYDVDGSNLSAEYGEPQCVDWFRMYTTDCLGIDTGAIGGNGYASEIRNMGTVKANFDIIDSGTPRKGDIFVDYGAPGHVGVVIDVYSDGTFRIADVNGTNDNGEWQKNQPCTSTRSSYGYLVRPDFITDTEPPQFTSGITCSNVTSNGFKLTFKATDNVGITKVYAKIWSQYTKEENAIIVNGTYSSSTGTININLDSDVGIYSDKYYIYCVVGDAAGYEEIAPKQDSMGGMNGDSWEGAMEISLYDSFDTSCAGSYRAKHETYARIAPKYTANGYDTKCYKIPQNTKVEVVGSYTENGVQWYRLNTTAWVLADEFSNHWLLSGIAFGSQQPTSVRYYYFCNQSANATKSLLVPVTQELYKTPTSTYTPAVRYTVTFDANGGTCATQTKQINENGIMGALPEPTRFGYTFDGWFTQVDGGTQVTSSSTCTGNTTLYAHWTRIVLLQGSCGPSLDYILYGDGELDVTGSGDMTSCPWTSSYAKRVVDVHLSSEITSFCNSAFSGCIYLNSINIPDVESLSGYIFENCSALTEIFLPNSITEIGSYAFSGCTSLKQITLPENLESLGRTTNGYSYGFAFKNCTSLQNVNIPKTLTSAKYAFYGCTNLKNVSIENGLTTVPSYIFDNSGIQSIIIPNTVTEIGSYAFENCTLLNNVVLSENLLTIGDYAFNGCISLQNIDIPNTVKNINSSAFASTDLNSLTLPKSLETLGSDVIYGNKNITEIVIPNKVTSCGYAFEGSIISKVIVEDGIKVLPKYTFCNCTTLTDVVLPDSITEIGYSAFYNCISLKQITLPKNLESLGYITGDSSSYRGYAFYNCTSLETIVLPDLLKSLQDHSFYGCSSLKNVYIPDGITSLGDSTFQNCTSLETIDLPTGLKRIDDNLFSGCSSLERITFRNNQSNLTSIDSGAFYGCSSLKQAVLPDSVTTIGSSAFYGCTSLTQAIIPEKVSSVGSSAFYGCTALEKVYIPQSVKTLGSRAFMGCELLTDVTISDYSINTLESETFKNCYALESIVLPKGLAKIGSQVFMNDILMFNVTIPDSVTSIDTSAFSYATKTTIHGSSGTYVETFAITNEFIFDDINNPCEGIIPLNDVDYVVMDIGETYRAVFEYYPEDMSDTIKLTASNSRVTINGMDIKANNTGDVIITATTTSGVDCQVTIHIRAASKISITNMPDKLNYVIGEELDLTGLKAQVTYNDSSFREITDYTVSGFDSSKEGTSTVTVKWVSAYGTTYSTTFTVNVIDLSPELTGIIIGQLPNKTAYVKREKLDTTGLVVLATYSDGSTKEVTDYKVTGFNTLKTGDQILTVTYEDFTTTFSVTVGEGTHAHSYSPVLTKAATCTETGIMTYTCSCGDSYTETIPALGHEMSEWVVVTEPTVSIDGVIRRTCKHCDYYEEYAMVIGGEDKVRGIEISSNKEILMIGDTTTLTAEIIPGTASNKTITWTSLDTNIATVVDGVVTANCAGSTVIIVETVDGGYKDFCLIRVVGITPKLNTTAVVDYDNGMISGIAPKLDSLDSFIETAENGLTLSYSTDTIGTGTTVNVCKNGEVVDAYTTVIFGDVNGDGVYDGMDAMIVNCIANGMLTKEQVGEAVYMAADCNHDGVIDNLDVDILQQAGILLASVDQSKSEEELLETSSAYVEYLNLIDQTVETKTTEVVDEEPVEPGYTFNFFETLITFIKEFIVIIKSALAVIW